LYSVNTSCLLNCTSATSSGINTLYLLLFSKIKKIKLAYYNYGSGNKNYIYQFVKP